MDAIQHFYNENAQRYEQFENLLDKRPELFPLLSSLRKEEREHLKHTYGHVLYLAMGTGSDVISLVNNGASVVTIDFSETMIARAVEQMHQGGMQPKVYAPSVSSCNLEALMSRDVPREDSQSDKRVVIIQADIRKVQLPFHYFDHCFCYCTLPLMGEDWQYVLEQMVHSSTHGAISIYDDAFLPVLAEYYATAGFSPTVRGKQITLPGGYRYTCLSLDKVVKIIEDQGMLVRNEPHGLGNLISWEERKG